MNKIQKPQNFCGFYLFSKFAGIENLFCDKSDCIKLTVAVITSCGSSAISVLTSGSGCAVAIVASLCNYAVPVRAVFLCCNTISVRAVDLRYHWSAVWFRWQSCKAAIPVRTSR